jgi:hypothetical protein
VDHSTSPPIWSIQLSLRFPADMLHWRKLTNGHAALGTTVSPIINVNVGDQITGTIQWVTSTCNGSTGYLINAEDNSLNQASYLYYCKSDQNTIGFSSAVEAYNINSCNQFPSQSYSTFTSISITPSVTWSPYTTSQLPSCGYAAYPADIVHIHSYPTTDIYTRSHGMSIDQSLPNPWWPPYQSGYQIQVTGSTFDYYQTLSFGTQNSHYIQEAAFRILSKLLLAHTSLC